ncbi:MAG: SGNH/GDSL hydrolase family protein, partial [Acidobacteriota bacterium]|nr:SGNH/GDSL hydrolase family protein [Acidobacteriota bacterium]
RDRRFSTNEFGMRGSSVERSKPPGVVRVVGLGDSYMFGWGVSQEETYLALLNESFAEEEPKIEFLNFGTPGYNTAMEVALYEHKARHFEPDLILIHFVGNDLSLPHHLQPPRDVSPANWHLIELIRAVLAAKALDGELELLPHDLTSFPERVQEEVESHYDYMLGPQGYRHAMARFAELAHADSVPVVIMSLGPRDIVEQVASEHGFRVLETSSVFAELMEKQGIEVTRDRWRELLRLPGDIHPSPFAHMAYAEAIRRELSAQGLARAGTAP